MALAVLASASDAVAWIAARGATSLASDSRRVARGAAFIAWPGRTRDAREFVGSALEAGAAACVVEADGADSDRKSTV